MKEISKALTSVSEGFLSAIGNSTYQTESGRQLLNKYQSYALANPIDCSTVNNFVREAKNHTYDSGVLTVLEAVDMLIGANKYSWLLESACEQLERSRDTYSYLNRNAVKLVRPLLKLNESELVQKIRAGALKDAMHCDPIRNICKSVYNSAPIVENYSNFKAVHPVSYLERKGAPVYFCIEGVNYKLEGDKIEESAEPRSNEYNTINRLLASNAVNVTDGAVTFNAANFSVEISEAGKAKKIKEDRVHEYTVDQFREHNALLARNYSGPVRVNLEGSLEALAKLSENFNNMAVINNATIFSTFSDRFLVIEHNGKAYAKLLNSTRNSAWSTENNIYEVVNFIRKKTNCDLTEYYKESIDKVISESKGKEAEKIKESLKEKEIQQRVSKIEELSKVFADDPVKLAVLSKVAEDINSLR